LGRSRGFKGRDKIMPPLRVEECITVAQPDRSLKQVDLR
jgi:hypothetical protein